MDLSCMIVYSEVASKGSNEGKCASKPVNRAVMVVGMRAMQGRTVRAPAHHSRFSYCLNACPTARAQMIT